MSTTGKTVRVIGSGKVYRVIKTSFKAGNLSHREIVKVNHHEVKWQRPDRSNLDISGGSYIQSNGISFRNNRPGGSPPTSVI